MFNLTFLFVNLIIAAPELVINWNTAENDRFEFVDEGHDSSSDKCLDNGLEAQYRFEAKVCINKNAWFEDCSDELIETRFLSQDLITKDYRLVSDRHRDGSEPTVENFSKLSDAKKSLRSVESVELSTFLSSLSKGYDRDKLYLRARLLSKCQGELSETWTRLSYYLSFGLIRIEGFDSGWQSYDLK